MSSAEQPRLAFTSCTGHARDELTDQRWQIIRKYAQLTPTADVAFCFPSSGEVTGEVARKEGEGTDGKIIYPDQESAEACGKALEPLGNDPQRAYRCGRSPHGHFHVTRASRVDETKPAAQPATPLSPEPAGPRALVEQIARRAIFTRVGHAPQAVISVTDDPERNAVILHVNSGGNALACEHALRRDRYAIEYDPTLTADYGVKLRVLAPRLAEAASTPAPDGKES